MGMIKEFKEFAMNGNVMDMAIGIILGAAFGKVVNSLVDDVLVPPIGRVVGGVDFGGLFLNLGATHYDTLAAAKAAGAPTLDYGMFLQSIFDFILVAFAVFLVIKGINQARRKEGEKPAPPAPPPPPSAEEKLLSEIRDLLRARA